MTRWIPRLILALGVAHLAYGFVETDVAADMIRDGFVGTGDLSERGYFVWYEASGLALLALGSVAGWSVRTVGRLPAPLGWWMIAVGLLITLAWPLSGGWAVLTLGVLALVDVRRRAAAARATPARL